jgi:nitrogen PTS system EIIA component
MMDAIEWPGPHQVLLDLDVPSRQEALRAVSAEIERSLGLRAPPVFRALWRREQAASTALGGGFALPHARIAGISRVMTVYVRIRTPIDFEAPDRRPVSELFVLLVPDRADNEKHLRLLALIAEMFSDRKFRARLSRMSDPIGIQSIFRRWIDQRAWRGGIGLAA